MTRILRSVSGSKDGAPPSPVAPGWYPDPWSATGQGERYFDGKLWGSTERPRARHSVPVEDAPLAEAGRKRTRRSWRPAVALVVVFALVWAYQSSRGTGSSTASPPPTPHSTLSRLTARPPASTEEASQPLGGPARSPRGHGGYAFVRTQRDGSTPVAFDPCRPIHYVVNLDGAPRGGRDLVQRAIGRVHDATGLRFVYDGPTNEAPSTERAAYQPGRYDRARWAPVLIAWSDETAYPTLRGNVAGIGGAQAISIDENGFVNVSGQVVLDRDQLSTDTTSDRQLVRAVVLHELGHVVGLDHTPDRSQLMFSEAQFDVRDYADGDLRGLHELGVQRCFPNV